MSAAYRPGSWRRVIAELEGGLQLKSGCCNSAVRVRDNIRNLFFNTAVELSLLIRADDSFRVYPSVHTVPREYSKVNLTGAFTF